MPGRDRHPEAQFAAPATLDAVLADAWSQLAHGASSAKHGFHLPVLCTAALDVDAAPEARTVVLRASSGETRTVVAHTDTRSPKAEQLRKHPHATWLFYDAPKRRQVRITGPTALLTFDAPDADDRALVQQRWDASTLSSRRCYLAPHPPGTEADAPSPNLPPEFRDTVPETAEQTEPGQANFAVIRTRAATLEVLHLHHAGHRRAAFTFDEAGNVTQQTWLEV